MENAHPLRLASYKKSLLIPLSAINGNALGRFHASELYALCFNPPCPLIQNAVRRTRVEADVRQWPEFGQPAIQLAHILPLSEVWTLQFVFIS